MNNSSNLQASSSVEFFYTSKVMNLDGSHGLIDFPTLIEKVKNPPFVKGTYAEAKEQAECIGAHNSKESKRKSAVIENDAFTLLRLDLDDGITTIQSVRQTLEYLNLNSYIIHTTAKHRLMDYDTGEFFGNRLRVLIPLNKPHSLKEWSLMQLALSHYFTADTCADRPQQIMYLPVRFDGDFYEYHIERGHNQNFAINDLIRRGEGIQALINEDASKVDAKPLQRKEHLPTANSVSIIEVFNNQFSIEDVLRAHNYRCIAGRWRSPFSKSGSIAGLILESCTDGKRRYYTHSTSEREFLGLDASKSYDAFDMYSFFNANGRTTEAVKLVASRYFQDLERHNRREYAVNRHNQEVRRLM
jgi:hypothetical protein